MAVFQFVADRIGRWLFREGGRYNLAIGRVAIGLALFLTITHHGNFDSMAWDWAGWVKGYEPSGWTPKGIIKIANWWWSGPPPADLTLAIFLVSKVAIIMMIVGFLTFPAQIIATMGTLYIVSLQTSYGPYWSHAYNVQLLAALSFMFSRTSSDVLSVDSIIRNLLGGPRRSNEGHYWWPVVFAELSTTLFMFGAFLQKFRTNGFDWAWSDNIRNSLAVSWFQYRSDPPPLVEFIASHAEFWKTAGTLQLVAQATTALAAILVARPLFRLIFGGFFFLLEIIALGRVFRFWHPFWVPLCLLSIDWEHFYAQFKERRLILPGWAKRNRCLWLLGFLFQRRIEMTDQHPRMSFASAIPVLGFGVTFLGYYLATLYWQLGEKHLNYPFSTMGFYSENRAVAPYGVHRFFPIYTGRIDAYRKGDKEPVPLWYRVGMLEDRLFRVSTIAELKELIAVYRISAERGLYQSVGKNDGSFNYAPVDADRIVLRAGMMAVPPYPQPVGMVDYFMGLRAVGAAGQFRALVGHPGVDDTGKQFVDIDYEGFKKPSFEIWQHILDPEATTLPKLVAVSGEWKGDRFFPSEEISAAYVMIRVQDPILEIDETYYGADLFRN